MFVELDELRLGDNQEWAWQEKARWIKFEEEIEEGAVRWGKPHVSSLSFHSLLELRRCLEQGLAFSVSVFLFLNSLMQVVMFLPSMPLLCCLDVGKGIHPVKISLEQLGMLTLRVSE